MNEESTTKITVQEWVVRFDGEIKRKVELIDSNQKEVKEKSDE